MRLFRRKPHPMSDVQPADFDAYIAHLRAEADAEEHHVAEPNTAVGADAYIDALHEHLNTQEAEVARLHRLIADADHSPATRLASQAWLDAHTA